MVTLRSPARTPSPVRAPRLNDLPPVNIHHPGYDDATDILLSLTPTDIEEKADGRFASGVQCHAVHTACALVANNRFDGWIALDKAGTRVEMQEHDMLAGGDYWFHVPEVGSSGRAPAPCEDALAGHRDGLPHDVPSLVPLLSAAPLPYPVVPTFRDWRFPDQLPSHFSNCLAEPLYSPPGTLPEATAVRQRDMSCRVTAAVDSTERAHVIPASEREWFGTNNMARFARSSAGRDAIDSQFNGLLLREDVHTLYDRMWFSFIPKADHSGSWSLAAHVNNPRPPTIFKAYHNQILRPVRGVVPQYLLARFAWDIFPQVRAFLQGGRARRLAVPDANGNTAATWYSGERCRNLCERQGPGRSTSPSKRKRDEGRNEDVGGDLQSAEMATSSPDSGVSGLDSSRSFNGDDRSSDHQLEEEEVEEQGEGRSRAVDELAAEAEEELAAQSRRRARRKRECGKYFERGAEAVQEQLRGRKRRRRGSFGMDASKASQ